jgi:hypothetical protein
MKGLKDELAGIIILVIFIPLYAIENTDDFMSTFAKVTLLPVLIGIGIGFVVRGLRAWPLGAAILAILATIGFSINGLVERFNWTINGGHVSDDSRDLDAFIAFAAPFVPIACFFSAVLLCIPMGKWFSRPRRRR